MLKYERKNQIRKKIVEVLTASFSLSALFGARICNFISQYSTTRQNICRFCCTGDIKMYILTDILTYVPVCICTWLQWSDASIANNITCKYKYKYKICNKYKICIVSNILTVIRLCACLHRFLLTGPDWLSPGPLPRPHPSSQGIRIRVLPFLDHLFFFLPFLG